MSERVSNGFNGVSGECVLQTLRQAALSRNGATDIAGRISVEQFKDGDWNRFVVSDPYPHFRMARHYFTPDGSGSLIVGRAVVLFGEFTGAKSDELEYGFNHGKN